MPQLSSLRRRSSSRACADAAHIGWTFNERIHDGCYCAESLAILRRYIEEPELLVSEQLELPLPAPIGAVDASGSHTT